MLIYFVQNIDDNKDSNSPKYYSRLTILCSRDCKNLNSL